LKASLDPISYTSNLSKSHKKSENKNKYPTNGSTGQREKAPAEPVCLITLYTKPKNRIKTENRAPFRGAKNKIIHPSYHEQK